MNKFHYHYQTKKSKEEILKKIFEITSLIFESLFYSAIWLVKIIGTIIAGILYGLAIGLVFVSKELWRFGKWAKPYVKNFFKNYFWPFLTKYFFPTIGRILVLLAIGLKYLAIYLALGIKYFFIYLSKGVYFALSKFWHWVEYDFAPWADNVFIPWVKNKFVPFVKAKVPVVANAAAVSAKYFALAVFYLIKGIYLLSEAILKIIWQAVSILTTKLQEFFGPKAQYLYDHRAEIKASVGSRLAEYKLFIFWLLKPITKLIPDKFERGFLPEQRRLQLALQPAIGFSDFKQLIRDPRQTLLRKILASWMIFFIIVSISGIASFTPLFDWLFQNRQPAYAAPFTGQVKISKQTTTLSTNGGWYTSLAHSGDGINGDAESGTFNPIHPGSSADGTAGQGLAVGYLTAAATTFGNSEFIGFKPNANANLAGVILVMENTNVNSRSDADIVVELLQFPSAVCTTSCTNYVTGSLNNYTYPADTVVLRRTVWQFNQGLSGENLAPGNFGRATFDFRFDPPVAVTTDNHYGIRIINMGAGSPVFGTWGQSPQLNGFPTINGTIRTIGVNDIDNTNAPTVSMPLALTGNNVLTTGGMVAGNSSAGVGMPTVRRTENEHWTATYSSTNGNWTITGSISGTQTNKLTTATTGGTGASWVNDNVPITTLTTDSTNSATLCVASISGFSANQYIQLWDSDTAPIQYTIASVNASDSNCSDGPSIITTAATVVGYTTNKNATVAQAIWKQRIIQGAEQAFTQNMPATNKICVADASQFSVRVGTAASIAIWDNNSAILDTNAITAITIDDSACTNPNDDSLTLASSITAGTYTVDQNARVAEISTTLSNTGVPADGAVMRWTSFNHTQNPTASSNLDRKSPVILGLAKNLAPAASNTNYPFLSNYHIFFTAYGDANTNAPADGDIILVGNGKTDPDTGDSPNLTNDLNWSTKESHVVTVDRDWDAALAYTGNYGAAILDGAGVRNNFTTYSQNGGWVSAVISPGSQLLFGNSPNTHYRITIPGKIVIDSDASLAFGKPGAAIPASSFLDIYFDNVSPSASTLLTSNTDTGVTLNVVSTSGFNVGDTIIIRDNNSAAITRVIGAIEDATHITVTTALVAGYTTAEAAYIAKGPTTELPTGADRRAGVYTMTGSVGNFRAGRVSLYSQGSDSFRIMKSDLAVDIDGDIDTGFLGNNLTDSGNTWLDVKDNVVGNWQPLDLIAAAGATNQLADNEFSSIRMGGTDDANVMPLWTGGTGAGGRNALPTPNMEVAEIGTIPLTNIYNSDYNGGSPLYSSNYNNSAAWTIFGDGANTEVNDAVYFGDQGSNMFYSLEFNLGTAMVADASYVWEYWNGDAWTSFTPRDAYKYEPRTDYCMPLSANTVRNSYTLTVPEGGTNFGLDQIVAISDSNSPTIYRRLGTTAPTATTLTFSEPLPAGYDTAQNAKVCRLNGGRWIAFDPSTIFTNGTGRRILSWTPSNLAGTAAKTTVNGINAYWVRARISSFTSWTTSPTNQTTPVSMSGVERVSSGHITISSGVQEAKITEVTPGASYDPNEQWILEYGNSPGWLEIIRGAAVGALSAPYLYHISDGVLNFNSTAIQNWAIHNSNVSLGATDYIMKSLVKMDMVPDATSRRLGLMLRQNLDGNGYAALITKTNTASTIGWYTTLAGVPTLIGSATTKAFAEDTWYCLKAEVTGTTLRTVFWATTDCEVGDPGTWDNTQTNTTYTNGRIGLYTGSATANQGMKAQFDNVNVSGGATFSDTFTDTGTWRVVGSIHGLIGTATPNTPFVSNYLNFTIKHKGGRDGVSSPEIGDKIYLSSTAIRSYKGLDAATGISTSNANTKYEVWDFEWNPSSNNYTVTGSASGASGSATPGTTYTAPNNQISLKIPSGSPTATKFGNRMLLLQDNLLRNNGSWTGVNGIGSAVLIYPSYSLSDSPVPTRYNIEGQSGTANARQRGTIDFWFKTNYSGSPSATTSPNGMYLFDYANQGNTDRIFIRHTPEGYLEAAVHAGSVQGTLLRQSFSATSGQWYHFRLVWSEDAAPVAQKRAWLDGVAFSIGQGAAQGGRYINSGLIRLGNRWTYDAPFDGSIDEFAIFDEDIDTSPNCDWGNFTPPTSAWTNGATIGCSSDKSGVNIFRASFDSAMNPQEGFIWADYAYGNPAMIFTNGADTGNERFRIITYPQRTRVWIDNTGEKYTPSARIKSGSGFLENAALATLTGWSHNFTYHHKAKRDSATNPTYSPVLNLKRSTHIWSEEPFTYTGATVGAPINAGLGFGATAIGLSGLATMNVSHLSMENQYSNFSIMTNPYTSVKPYPSQTITNSVFYNYYDRAYTVSGKSQGTNYVGAYFVTTHFSSSYIGAGYNAGTSQNVGIDGSIFMGTRNSNSPIPPSGPNGAASFYSGRLYTIRNSEFYNNGVSSGYGPTGALNFGPGVAKLTIENNIFSINTNGIRLYGNSFVAMSGNVFDGHTSNDVTTVGSEYGAGIRAGQTYTSVFVSDNGSIFGRGLWNEADINLPPDTTSFQAGSMLQLTGQDTVLSSPIIFGTVDYDNMGRIPEAYFHTTIPGTDIRFISGKDIINFTTFGNMRTTGSGLTDTIVRTSGGYGWRLDPRSSDTTLDYVAKVVGVAGKPLAVTGYLRMNQYYGSSGLPTVTLSGLGMTGPNLTWTAQPIADTWQQFVVTGTPTESALAEVKISVSLEGVEAADSGTSQIIANPMGNYLPPLIEDTDKSWTPNQWVGYLMKDKNGKIFEIVKNTEQLLYVKGTVVPHLLNTTFTAATPGDYIIFRQPMVYLDDISVLSGTVDTGTLDFYSAGQPVSPWLSTGLTAEAVWSAQYSIFSDITGSMGQLLNDRLAVKRGLVSDANATQTQFITNLTETTSNFYQNQVIVLMSGQNAGISRRIASYDGTEKKITVDEALPFAPAFNDEFVILSQYAAYAATSISAQEIWEYPTRLLTGATLTGGGSIATQADIQALNNLSAQQVWEYGARTLTGGVILSDPTQVWNVATSLLSTAGTIGKLIVDNLDVAVSTRSTLTAADVWAAAERTITGITDPGLAAIAANVWAYATRELTAGDLTAQRVWDTLLSAITTTNSIGLLLKTNIDAQLSVVKTDLTTEINQNEAKLDTLISNLIVAQSSVNDTGATVTQFITNLTNTNDDFYNNGVLVFTSGLNSGQVRQISDYSGADKKITVTPGLTVAPSNGDTFTILAQTANASLDAAAIWSYATRRLTDAQLDSGSLATLANLQTTETNLTNQIAQTQKITVGKIINQDTSIKSGNSLTILFRADSGLTGNNRPLINVWDPSGTQVVTDQYMTELGSTGVYKYAVTFESAWGTGQFTVQASETTNNTKDSINISVTATDLATIGTTIDLLAQDLISIRSTVGSGTNTESSFSTNLTSAVNGLYNNALITFTSGANAGVARRIENYNGTTKVLTIEPDLPLAPADGDAFTILKQIAVPTTKIATIQTDVATVKSDVALIKSRLDNIDSNITALQNKVQQSVVQVYQIRPEDMFTQMSTISSAIQSINTTLGKLDTTLLASLLSVSQESLTDIKYIRNKLADFKAVTIVQRQILESPESGIIKAWYTSGSVDLNIMVTNPSGSSQKIPVKIYLPKEAKMEHIMDNDGLDIQYDVQLDTLYAQGEFQLGPRESLKKTIKMRDIWQIAEEDLNLMKTQAENLLKQLEETQFSAQAVLLKNDLDSRIDKIIRTQAENIASPQDKIMTYRENKESLSAVQRDLDELKSLVTQSAAARGFLGAFGGIQTIVIWGIIIAFITGFSLMIMVLFTMWRHQMRLAGGQLALQSHILSGGKVDTQTLAKIFADGVVTKKEEEILGKYLTQSEIERVKKRLSKEKIQEISKKFSISFFSYFKKSLAKFGLKIFVILVAVVLIAGLIFVLPKIIKGVSDIFSGARNTPAQTNVQPPAETAPAIAPESQAGPEFSASPIATTSELTTSDSEQKFASNSSNLGKPIFILIKKTPTGWLNVRKEPSKTAKIIAKVNSGERLETIGLEEAKGAEKFGWYNIILPDGQTGWVYAEYVQISLE